MERLYTFTVKIKGKTYTTVVPEYTLIQELYMTRKEWSELSPVVKEMRVEYFLNTKIIPQYVEASWSC